MTKLCRFVATVAVAGCATGPDSRPETADYISEAILVPYCGRGACHSSATAAHGLVFETPADSIAAMTTRSRGELLVVPGNPTISRLVTVLRDSNRVMPPDVPLTDADVALITKWVADGAEGLP